ncbi:MAG: hypothetical protein U1A78_03665 [Polyangia bacterium]
MQAFHAADTGRRLLDVARVAAPEGKPDALMLTECAPEPGEQQPSWCVIRFELVAIRVSWRTFGLGYAARAAFRASVAVPRKLDEVAHG